MSGLTEHQPDEALAQPGPAGSPAWSYTDPDGDTITLDTAPDASLDTGTGPGVHITTSRAGVVIPATGLQAFVAALVEIVTAAAKEADR